jgi:Family of unknown function (DUF6084)
MGEFAFDCLDGRAEPYAALPTLLFRLRIAETTGLAVESIALRCQIRIEPQRRHYSAGQQERLADLFGEPSRWGETLKPFQLATVPVMVPAFRGSVDLDIPVPCSYDLEVAAGQYFHALDDGEVSLLMLFSGTVFAKNADGGLRVEQVPWHKETTYRLPARVWRDLMDMYFPNSGWLRARRDTIDALGRFKSRHALPTWDDTLSALLKQAGEQ